MDFENRESMIQYVEQYPNLVILRTLSKAFAMAGLRIGCTIANHEIIEAMQSILAPYPIPRPCIEAATEALSPAAISAYKSQWDKIISEYSFQSENMLRLISVNDI